MDVADGEQLVKIAVVNLNHIGKLTPNPPIILSGVSGMHFHHNLCVLLASGHRENGLNQVAVGLRIQELFVDNRLPDINDDGLGLVKPKLPPSPIRLVALRANIPVQRPELPLAPDVSR